MPAAEITAVDCHAHVFERGLPLAAQRRHAPEFDALVDDYLALLDAHGVSHGVLVQPSFLGTDNHYFLDAVARHPRRLRGVAVVDAATPLKDLRRLHDQGVRGLRLNLVGIDIPGFDSPGWQALQANVRALDWHLEIHRDAHDLPRILAALLPGGCRLVIDHLGRPDPASGTADRGFQALLRAADTGRIWVKLSAAYRSVSDPRSARETATALLGAFGPGRLVWGSDWPHTQHRESVDFESSRALLDDWVPDPAQRLRVLVETPAELFAF